MPYQALNPGSAFTSHTTTVARSQKVGLPYRVNVRYAVLYIWPAHPRSHGPVLLNPKITNMPGGLHPTIEIFLEWPRPNYVDPVTKPKYVLILSCILGPISLALLLVRFWVRLRIQQNPGWDDWLMLASWFPTIALTFIFPWSESSSGDLSLRERLTRDSC